MLTCRIQNSVYDRCGVCTVFSMNYVIAMYLLTLFYLVDIYISYIPCHVTDLKKQ